MSDKLRKPLKPSAVCERHAVMFAQPPFWISKVRRDSMACSVLIDGLMNCTEPATHECMHDNKQKAWQ